ncbi:MAG: hypothetical protein RLY31_913 [Bacteroidota bacterium]|jgi:NAD(P)-dependent dehydrogenase (short-subunit alcohol dehydrogenase family)
MKVLVTGGASGLGADITRTLAADDGIQVYFTYCRSAAAAAELVRQHPNVRGIRCDFEDANSMAELLRDIPGWELDGLVNNAMAGFLRKHFHKIPAESFGNSFRRNVLPVVQVTQAALQGFRARRHGRILTVLTAALANRPPVGWSEYVANKAYLLSLSKSWATEYAKYDITSNCISPTFMPTPLNEELDERMVEEIRRQMPRQELLPTTEVARLVRQLLTGSGQVNGVNLLVNQGADIV